MLNGVGSRAVPLGDSTTKGSDNNLGRGLSWPLFASLATNEAFHYVANAGVSGNTSAMMLARFDTDVTPHHPDLVPILAGVNDINGSVPLATFQANIIAIIAKVKAIGARPVLCTITPGAPGAVGLARSVWNAWLRGYAASQRIILVDFYSALVDPATGNYLAAYSSGDNVHPREAGYAIMGATFAATLAPFLSPVSVPVLGDVADTSNYLQGANPLWLGGLTGNVPTGWGNVNGNSMTGSLITGDPTIHGSWYRMTFAASAADVTINKSLLGVGITGHTYAFTGRIKTALSVCPNSFYLQCGTGAVTEYAVGTAKTTPYSGRFWLSFVCGGANLVPAIYVKAGTTGTIDLAEVAIFDVTALGIDSMV